MPGYLQILTGIGAADGGAGFAGMALGLFLMVWIVIQVKILGGIHWLHILCFILGGLEAGLGFLIFRHTNKKYDT